MAVYFSILLVIITVLTGIVYFLNKFYLAPQRSAAALAAQEIARKQTGIDLTPQTLEALKEAPVLVDTAVQIFPVIAFVLVLRSFIYEPFQIPSGSMMPTLLDGDFILVNKFNYGLKDPVARNKFVDIGLPERGDVVVFKYPRDTRIDYIKRVVGLPGDSIIYRDKSIFIKRACRSSDVKCPEYQRIENKLTGAYQGPDSEIGLEQYQAEMGDITHDLLIDKYDAIKTKHFFSQKGTMQDEFIVPNNQYFVIGDNRDNSLDGRFWGFVPEANLVGQAVAIWMSFDFERTPDDFLPRWIPTGIRFNRIGAIH
jgi:signal peptidase I